MDRSCSHSETECQTCWKERIGSIGFVGHRVNASGQFGRDVAKKTESELADYRAERKAGSMPDGTTRAKIERSKRISDKLGVPYNGANRAETAQKAGLIDSVAPTRGHYKKFL